MTKRRRSTPMHASEALSKMVALAGPRERQLMSMAAEHYMREVRANKHEPPHELAAGLNAAVSNAVQHTVNTDPRGGEVKCREGCSHCCHIPVHVTPAEAALLVHTGRMAINSDRLREQAGMSDAQFMALPIERRRCVFLSDNRCSVYEHRPMNCRKHMVISDPIDCDTAAHPGHRVLQLVSWEGEVIAASAATVLGGSLMATAITKHLKELAK